MMNVAGFHHKILVGLTARTRYFFVMRAASLLHKKHIVRKKKSKTWIEKKHRVWHGHHMNIVLLVQLLSIV